MFDDYNDDYNDDFCDDFYNDDIEVDDEWLDVFDGNPDGDDYDDLLGSLGY